jgi:hypothetical protein
VSFLPSLFLPFSHFPFLAVPFSLHLCSGPPNSSCALRVHSQARSCPHRAPVLLRTVMQCCEYGSVAPAMSRKVPN